MRTRKSGGGEGGEGEVSGYSGGFLVSDSETKHDLIVMTNVEVEGGGGGRGGRGWWGT